MQKNDFCQGRPVIKMILGMVLLICFIGISAVPNANAWWDGKWKQRKEIQFDASSRGADIKENLTDFPVLVRLHTGSFNFSAVKPDGSDIRFVSADDKVPLKYQIEKFDTKEEIALIWVKVPRISGGSAQDSIWMYYGNPSVPDGQEAGSTYDVNEVAVLHLGDKDGSPRDSTAYNNHATFFNGKLGIPTVIGNGAQFGGDNEQIKIDRSASLTFARGLTFSIWIRLNLPSASSSIFSWEDGNQSVVVGLDASRVYCSLSTDKGRTVVTPRTPALALKQWYNLAVTIEPDEKVTVYINGSEAAASSFKGTVPSPSADIYIGASVKKGDAFKGDLDEIRLSNVARTASWIQASFQSQGPDGLLTSYLEEESGGGGSESLTVALMKVIIRTITLDGWLIIGFLFFMGCASLYVFIQKLSALRQAKKGNEIFSQSFRKIEHPLSLIEKQEEFPASSLYRVYRVGCEELADWLARTSEAFKNKSGISENVMNGFRTALDKEAMYESRKLSSGMVIMNMSVAGGPFLGLLGTVWGVMNTFASLAVSGEANLTAIAPGVASALACTMAGLLVAIPSLFGSTYITGLIKDMNADVNMFIDDFILRLEAERGDEQ